MTDGDVNVIGVAEYERRLQARVHAALAEAEKKRRANSPWVLVGPFGPMRHKHNGLSYQACMAHGTH